MLSSPAGTQRFGAGVAQRGQRGSVLGVRTATRSQISQHLVGLRQYARGIATEIRGHRCASLLRRESEVAARERKIAAAKGVPRRDVVAVECRSHHKRFRANQRWQSCRAAAVAHYSAREFRLYVDQCNASANVARVSGERG